MWLCGGVWMLFSRSLGICRGGGTTLITGQNKKKRATIAAVLKVTQRTVIFGDSKYVLDSVKGEAHKWRRNGWCGPQGPVPNSMLWQALLQVIDSTPQLIKWAWSPSHQGIPTVWLTLNCCFPGRACGTFAAWCQVFLTYELFYELYGPRFTTGAFVPAHCMGHSRRERRSTTREARGGGGATTNGLDATTPPTICQNSGGGHFFGGVQPGVGGGGVPAGGRGGSGRGSGGRPARGEGGGLGLGSPSWWNQSWFYNPF